MTKPRKPHNPAEATERKLEIARLNRLGAEVNIDTRTGKILSARRSNVFNLLLARKSITQNQHDAVMRFADLWATWKGCDGGGGHAEKVDGATGERHSLMKRQLAARDQIETILNRIGPTDRALIRAFMLDYVELCTITVWRVTVQRITKIENKDKQTALVTTMCENLRLVMEAPKVRVAA